MTEKEKTMEKKEEKLVEKKEQPKQEKKEETKKEEKTTERKEEKPKAEEKKEDKKTQKETAKPKQKKEKAIVRAFNLRISKKYSKFVCRAIRGKTTQKAIELLENVIKLKTPIKMPTLEIAHQKGKGVAGAKYPVKAAKEIKELVKQLEANAHNNGIENPVISIAKADKGETVYKTEGRRAKRTNIYMEAIEKK